MFNVKTSRLLQTRLGFYKPTLDLFRHCLYMLAALSSSLTYRSLILSSTAYRHISQSSSQGCFFFLFNKAGVPLGGRK